MQLLFLGGGLWIIPLLMILGGVAFVWQANKAAKSNSTTQSGVRTFDNTGNVPITKLAKFWIGVALFAAAIAAVLLMWSER